MTYGKSKHDLLLIIVIVVLVILIMYLLRRDRKHFHRKNHDSHQFHSHQSDSNNSDSESSERVSREKSHSSQDSETRRSSEHTFDRKIVKSNMIPTFQRDGYDEQSEFNNYNRRYNVQSTTNKTPLPANFSSIKNWSGMITGVFDQERCGSCWAQSCASMLTDRFRIKSNGKELMDGDYLSPFYLAACMKCGKDNICPKVCEGNYLDDVLQYLVDTGTGAQSDIERASDNADHQAIPGDEGVAHAESYLCLDPVANSIRLYKGIRKYRVNIHPPSKLVKEIGSGDGAAANKNKKYLDENMTAIMEEIMTKGPVCCIIKVYTPNDYRNFYNHKSGIYGWNWRSEPGEEQGFHAVCVIGWGEEAKTDSDGKVTIVKYWIIRNSWGSSWAQNGYSRVLRGENFGMIEADLWGIDPAI